jgi:hypothetical protein
MNIRRIVIAVALLIVAVLGVRYLVRRPQPPSGPSVDARIVDAATLGLKNLLQTAANVGPAALGFQAGQLNGAGLQGPPIPVHYVRLDSLAVYPGNRERPLIGPIIEYIYPVFSGGSPLAAVLVQKQPDTTFDAVGFGGANLIDELIAARDAIVAARSIAADSVLLVKVPAFNLDFVGGWSGGRLWLSPLRADTLIPPSASDTADALFRALVLPAVGHDTLSH